MGPVSLGGLCTIVSMTCHGVFFAASTLRSGVRAMNSTARVGSRGDYLDYIRNH